ncbi:MAG: peptide ABC transporter substrate-binding protein [Caldilineaceae bacterium]|nr:peptide ABC transporter substrate-binding protein [Caldilineaceae bacterium]
MRWLVLVALIGVSTLLALLGYATYTVPTVLVPDRGGIFREGVAGTPQYLSPIWCQSDDVDRDLCALVYRGLTRMDKNGRVVPDLAEGWVVVDDRTYLFGVKPNQFWHDGRKVTAEDVLFTIGVLQDPSLLDIPGLPGLWRNIQVEQLDELTVRFTLPQPFAPFLDYTTVGLLPKHIYGEVPPKELVTRPLTENPVGSGPMRVAEVMPDHIRLEPSAFYGGATPYISALEFRFYPDYPSVLAAFEAQEIDGISRILPTDIKSAAAREDLQLFSSVESGYEDVLLNLNNPNVAFFQDTKVRQALLYGLDREAVVRTALAGQGIVAHSVLSPENWAYNEEVTIYPYDPDRARQLLDEAGWVDNDGDGVRDKDGLPLAFVLLVKDDNIHQQTGELIAQDWAALGVRALIQPVSFSGLVTEFLAPRTFDAALTDWGQIGDPDPYPQWHSSQIVAGGQNYSGWQNAEADQLMEAARAATNEDARRQLYADFQAIFAQELPALPLFHPVYTYGVSTRVHNVQIGALNTPAERFGSFPSWYIDSRRVPANQVPGDVPPTPPGAAPATDATN